MKPIKVIIVVLLTVLLQSVGNSQYFTNNNNYIPVQVPLGYDIGKIFFNLSEISTNRLDVSAVSNFSTSSLLPDIRYGQWNQNNGGTYGNYNNGIRTTVVLMEITTIILTKEQQVSLKVVNLFN